MQPTLHLIIDSAEMVIPLKPGDQPLLRLSAHVAASFDLLNDAHEQIGELPWEVTITRASGPASSSYGRAVMAKVKEDTESIEAEYRAAPEAFDMLERQLARGKSLVILCLEVEGIQQRPNESRWQWNKAKHGSNIVALTAHAEF